MMKLQKTGMKWKSSSRSPPDLSEEIIIEILVRLPVTSLLRCRTVCKAWRAIVSNPVFIRAHLRWEHDPALIISPHTLDYVVPGVRWPSTFSNHIRFYQWQPSKNQSAKFLHAKKFRGEFSRLCFFAHCDGLVLVPTNSKLYLFNPATRDGITLPDSNNRRNSSTLEACHCAGLGLDPRTGRYKVVQAFYRSVDAATNTCRMGMEVFTVGSGGGAVWREMAEDLPCPITTWQTGLTVKGRFLFWRVDRARHRDRTSAARGLVRLDLAEESFRIIALPDAMNGGDACVIDELGGELCLTAPAAGETAGTVTVWAMAVDGGGQQWERRYSVRSQRLCHPMAILPGDSNSDSDGNGGQVLFWNHLALYSYDAATCEMTTVCDMDRMRYQGRRARRWKNLNNFNVRPYTESLVPVSHGCLD